MKKSVKKMIALTALASVCFTGCATHELMSNGGSYKQVDKKRTTLVEDYVVAFAQPVTPLPNVPNNSIVIVGQKNSYVLTSGTEEFIGLIGKLDARYIQLTQKLDFFSAKNDGHFTGTLAFKYRKLKDDFTKNEIQYMLQYDVKDCTSYEDKNMQAQSFCFSIPLTGVIYPAVNNPQNLRKLSKPYPVSIYTEEETVTVHQESGKSVTRKLVLLPFALAFDVATLPFQALHEIFDD